MQRHGAGHQPLRVRVHRGLSLVEVLVVIVVLAILAGLLLPSLWRGRQLAQRTACMSNVRQLGLALQLYTDAFDAFPGSGDFSEHSDGGWIRVRREYEIEVGRGSLGAFGARDPRIYRCPGAGGANLAYAMSYALGWQPVARIERPASTALLLEEHEAGPAGRGPNDGSLHRELPADRMTERHAGGGIVVYADGHAKRENATRRWDREMFGEAN